MREWRPKLDKPLSIAISGKRYSGKTTLALRLCERYGLQLAAFADALKRGCAELGVGVEGAYKNRKVLQDIGLYFREQNPDYWIHQLDWNSAPARLSTGICVHDVRFPNELDWALNKGMFCVRLDVSLEVQHARAANSGLNIARIIEVPPSRWARLRGKPDGRPSKHISETALDDEWFRFNQVIDVDNTSADEVESIVAERIDGLLALEAAGRARDAA